MGLKKYIYLTLLLFTLTYSYAQNPGGVSGYNCWYAANNGVTPNTKGSTVTNWNCINCSTYNLTQDNPGIGPVYEQKLINFNPCVTFTNNNATIPTGNECLGNSTSFNQIQSGFIVERLDSTNPGYVGIVHEWEADNTALGRALGGQTYLYSNGRGGNDFARTPATTPPATDANGTHVDGALGLAHHYRWHICRVQIQTPYLSTDANDLCVGIQFGWYDFGHWPPDGICVGDLAEVIEYPDTLMYEDANRVESYLAIKHGITLNQTAPGISYRSSTYNIIWDSTNAPYNNNITGIGRDDASGLSQLQSLSIDSAGGVVTIYNGNVVGAFPASNIANTNTITADQNFEIFADNGATYNTLSGCYNSGKTIGIARIWNVQKTGAAIGIVTLSALVALLPAGTNSLIVSHGDPTFASANTTVYTLNNSGGVLSYALTLQNNDFFTFGDTISLKMSHVNTYCSSGANGSASVTFSAPVAPSSYSWNTTPIQTTSTATNLSVGLYQVTVTFGGGCTLSDTVSVKSSGNIAFPVSAITTLSCSNIGTGTAVITASGGHAPYEYIIGTNPHQENDTFKNLALGTYTYKVIDTAGCRDSSTFTINPVTFTISTAVSPSCINIPNGSAAITVTGGTSPYLYTLANATQQASNTYNKLYPGKYTFTITDNTGCTDTSSFKIDSALLTLAIATTPSCVSSGTGSITVLASGGKAPYTYSLDNELPVATGSYNNIAQGKYNLIIKDATGCITGGIANVDSIVLTDQKFTTPSCTANATGSLEIAASGGQPPYIYAISKQASGITIDSPFIVPIASGFYQITITDKQDCVLKDTITVPGIFCCTINTPTAFTPNGDGVNDYLTPIPLGVMTTYLFNIYDRWGNLVFTSQNVAQGWDGKFKGENATIGVYVYYIKATCSSGANIEKKGNITLLR